MTPEEALAAILETLHDPNPLKLRKAELLGLRHKVIEIASYALAIEAGVAVAELPVPKVQHPDPEYLLALRLVMGYDGPNAFMRDLQRAVGTYGGLTAGQADAVLRPPEPRDYDNMAVLGIPTETVSYHWQALDACRLARQRAKEATEQMRRA